MLYIYTYICIIYWCDIIMGIYINVIYIYIYSIIYWCDIIIHECVKMSPVSMVCSVERSPLKIQHTTTKNHGYFYIMSLWTCIHICTCIYIYLHICTYLYIYIDIFCKKKCGQALFLINPPTYNIFARFSPLILSLCICHLNSFQK